MAKWLKNKDKVARKVDDEKIEVVDGEISPAESVISTSSIEQVEPHSTTDSQTTAPVDLDAPLSQAEREAMIAEFMRNQAMRAEKALEKRKQSFISKIEGQREARTEITVRKLQIKRLRGEVQERRGAIKQLRDEIKGLRHQKVTTEHGDDVAA